MSLESFNNLVEVYRATIFDNGIENGSLIIETEAQIQLLRYLLSDPDEYGVTIAEGNVDEIHVGDQIRLSFEIPRLSIGIFALDFTDFLQTSRTHFREPERYFLADINFVSGEQEFPLLHTYRGVLSFIQLLKLSADYFDENNGVLVFLSDKKFDISVKYEKTTLEHIDISILNRMLNNYDDNIHRDQKLAILARSTQDLLSNSKVTERFDELLKNLAELEKRVSEGYRLFVSEFSYEKILDQMEIAKLEDFTKIHKTFSDIQNQILGIPVATVIVATQMKEVNTMGAGFWINTGVLIGCWIFAILSNFVLRNQLHTLEVIGEEIDRKERQLIKKFNAVRDLIGNSFPILRRRLKWQRIAFSIVDAVIVIGVVLAHFVYFALTDPARNFLLDYYIHNIQ